jgi:hypothetical protein
MAASSTILDWGNAVTETEAPGMGAMRVDAEARTAAWLRCISQAAAEPTDMVSASRARKLRMLPVSLLFIANDSH